MITPPSWQAVPGVKIVVKISCVMSAFTEIAFWIMLSKLSFLSNVIIAPIFLLDKYSIVLQIILIVASLSSFDL